MNAPKQTPGDYIHGIKQEEQAGVNCDEGLGLDAFADAADDRDAGALAKPYCEARG